MSAIWNSYSKSLTARSPPTPMVAPIRLAYAASRPSNASNPTRGSVPHAARSMSSRSCTGKSGSLAAFHRDPRPPGGHRAQGFVE